MRIEKNFLDIKDYQQLKQNMLSSEFPWYFNESSLSYKNKKSQSQFIHNFFKDNVASKYINILDPLLKKLNAFKIYRIKANLNPSTPNIIETGEHTDLDDDRFLSAILFINKCNGYCRINKTKIKSEDNKLLIFKSNQKHTGSTCTDADRRVLINLIYLIK